jgi:hypothetical protein
MKHGPAIKKRLERLERVVHNPSNAAYREAVMVLTFEPGPDGSYPEPTDLHEWHVVMTGSDGGRCFFEQRPGPGETPFGLVSRHLVDSKTLRCHDVWS